MVRAFTVYSAGFDTFCTETESNFNVGDYSSYSFHIEAVTYSVEKTRA